MWGQRAAVSFTLPSGLCKAAHQWGSRGAEPNVAAYPSRYVRSTSRIILCLGFTLAHAVNFTLLAPTSRSHVPNHQLLFLTQHLGSTPASSSSSSQQRFQQADLPCSDLQQQEYAEFASFMEGYDLSHDSTCSSSHQNPRFHSQSAMSHSTCASGLSGVSYSFTCTSMSTSCSTSDGRDRSCSSVSSSSSSICQQGGSNTAWILPHCANRQVLSEYEFGKDLGKGTFGVTRLVRDRTSAGPAACKSMCKTSIAGNQTQIEDIRREVAILRHLAGHDCVVNLRGVYEDTRQVHLVMDLCTGGDLHEYITTRPCGRLFEKDAAAVIKSMLEALAFCHGRGVVHRDVKPENVLLEKQGTVQTGVKVSDFGVSAWYKPGQVRNGQSDMVAERLLDKLQITECA